MKSETRIIIGANGLSGYLGRHFFQYVNEHKWPVWTIIPCSRKIDNFQVTTANVFINFSSPSDIDDFKNVPAMIQSMLDETYNNIKVCNQKKVKFIFCSSLATREKELNTYGAFKLAIEKFLESKILDIEYLILRIPRIYSADRPKGLIKLLREGRVPEEDMNNMVDFETVDSFTVELVKTVDKFLKDELKNEVVTFHAMTRGSIKDIKDIFNL